MSEPLHAAVIGYGFGGRVFHADPISRTEGLKLAAIVSSRKDEIEKAHPGTKAIAHPEEVFADPSISLVAISTPNTAHFPLAAAALEAGKHVVVDKPFTVTSAEARELKQRAEKAGKLLTVFHNFRYYSDFLTLKRLIADGTLGEIVSFESHFDRYAPNVPDAWRERPGPGAGTWWDLAPHLLDQVLQLFGMPQAIYADFAVQRSASGATDYFHALLRYEKLRVILTSCFLAPEQEIRFIVHGSKASFFKKGIDTREGPDRWPGRLVFSDGLEKEAPHDTADGRAFYIAMRDAILGGTQSPVALDEAIAVMDLLEAGERSAAEKREIAL
ncbi:putative dehydrogenase [Rhizomicrobium palustre]|jgi:predicted dehydrogenase|uniref:Putative dehydrogenase n=1 Tax=Rhizomicrobium palustre TaxID=189966 RepID=A0A846MUG1_9PROT|nr:oxidoreductase [Rhizomicrobium palustre]NIK86869.1 putative dehydrogenase [Rhizomicrobium palustre]